MGFDLYIDAVAGDGKCINICYYRKSSAYPVIEEIFNMTTSAFFDSHPECGFSQPLPESFIEGVKWSSLRTVVAPLADHQELSRALSFMDRVHVLGFEEYQRIKAAIDNQWQLQIHGNW